MATTNEIVSRIKRRLSRKDNTSLDASIIEELNATKEILEGKGRLPNFILKREELVVLPVTGIFDVNSLSETFLRLYDDAAVQIDRQLENTESEEQIVPLQRLTSIEDLKARFPGQAEVPLGWTYVQPAIIFRPRPLVELTNRIYVSYYFRDIAFTAGNSTVWSEQCGDLFVAHTGMEIAQTLRDKDAQAYFREKLALAWRDYNNRLTADEVADLDANMGED